MWRRCRPSGPPPTAAASGRRSGSRSRRRPAGRAPRSAAGAAARTPSRTASWTPAPRSLLCGGQVRETRTGVLLAHFTLSSAGAGLVCSISTLRGRTGWPSAPTATPDCCSCGRGPTPPATDVGAPVRSCARSSTDPYPRYFRTHPRGRFSCSESSALARAVDERTAPRADAPRRALQAALTAPRATRRVATVHSRRTRPIGFTSAGLFAVRRRF